ncbi:Protein neprosin [Cardamine amara subsp. amara]|uniref:Protein neprosin n=1 Tax=Cardamine amara subsp. amara TaxID=228776 RepID=A0ABD1C489_CARAN
MSSGIKMALVMNLLLFLFSNALHQSDQKMRPLISFKISENVTYDCIDIYKQPGLDHPLLKNHKIQMKPSVSKPELKNQTSSNKTYKKKIRCPQGTIPILRNSKEYITNARLFVEKYFHPLTGDSPGTHIAGVRSHSGPYRGVEAWSGVHNLNIGRDQASYGQIYIGSGLNNQVNFIQAGWMINPSLFGDGRPWSYGFWKGKDGKGCYNTACPGFVQVSQEDPISEPMDQPGEGGLRCSIHQDKQTGNWWITQLISHAPNIDIGYWPKELFNLLDNGANMVGVGGAVQASRSGPSPPMGNGKFPNGDRKGSSLISNIEVLDSNYMQRKMNSFPIETLLDSPKCYGLRMGKVPPLHVSQLGFFFNYGGPGGNSCGI